MNGVLSLIGTSLKEPLVQFLVLGVLVFVAFLAIGDPEDPGADALGRIVVDADVLSRLETTFEQTWRRAPSPGEVDRMVDGYVREEVLMREALALGLDRDDIVIRQRLRQKMEFLIQPAEAAAPPDDAVLQGFVAENEDAYRATAAVAFTQVFLGEHASPDDIETARAKLVAGAEPGTVAVRSLIPLVTPLSPTPVIDSGFGAGFGAAIAGLEPGVWAGPVQSGYGLHLVRIDGKEAARMPPLEDIREEVVRDWTAAEAKRIAELRYESLRQRYEVVRDDAAVPEPRP